MIPVPTTRGVPVLIPFYTLFPKDPQQRERVLSRVLSQSFLARSASPVLFGASGVSLQSVISFGAYEYILFEVFTGCQGYKVILG